MVHKTIDVCIISCYFKGTIIPDYLKKYILELSTYCSKVIIVTTNKVLLNLFNRSLFKQNNLEVFFVKNEGYDFGMWYKVLKNMDIHSFDSLLLTNDSCVLINPLDNFASWYLKQDAEYIGLVSSNESIYHYQSYFHIFKGKAIEVLMTKFNKEGFKSNYQEVVNKYELDMLTYLSSRNVKSNVLFDEGKKTDLNPMFFCVDRLLEHKIPIVKRQLIFGFKRAADLKYLKTKNFELKSIQKLIKDNSEYGKDYL